MGASSLLLRGCDNVFLFSDFLPVGADPATYAGKLSVCLIPVPKSNKITAATAATPIKITSAGHGLTTGDTVSIINVGGIGEAKGVWVITVVDADNFTLNTSVGTNTYTRGGEWYKALPDAAGVAFSGGTPQVVLAGSLGFDQNAGYVIVINITGANRDHWSATHYVSAVDKSL